MRPEITIDQCQLYKCRSKKRLAEILYIERADFNDIPTWATYRISHLEKGDGGTRTIYSPSKRLKKVQKRIKRLLERIHKPSWVFSSRTWGGALPLPMSERRSTMQAYEKLGEAVVDVTRPAFLGIAEWEAGQVEEMGFELAATYLQDFGYEVMEGSIGGVDAPHALAARDADGEVAVVRVVARRLLGYAPRTSHPSRPSRIPSSSRWSRRSWTASPCAPSVWSSASCRSAWPTSPRSPIRCPTNAGMTWGGASGVGAAHPFSYADGFTFYAVYLRRYAVDGIFD